jgi:RNA-directed DNA polymerase
MQESYGEDLASHTDPESCAVARKGAREALTGARAGGLLSREILLVRGADAVSGSGRLHPMPRYGERDGDLARSENLRMHGNISRENREVPYSPAPYGVAGRIGKSQDVSQ